MRVLIAQDDAVARLIARRAVERLGHECAVAGDGLEAWDTYDKGAVDVILSDWRMPGVDGLELCRRVREAGSYAYFVLMTSLDERDQILPAIMAGADECLTKPLQLDHLEATLITAMRVTALHRRLVAQNAELERLSRASHEAARTDALTLVGNRVRLHEDLAALRARASRYGHTYAAALCDIDHFRSYNERYGHLGGDEALRRVADAIRGVLRGGDTVYRYGGEEFLVILPEQTLAGAAIAMERVRRAVEELGIEHAANSPAGVVTLSAGIALLGSKDAGGIEEWLKQTDAALYRAKAAGRNRVALLDAFT